MRRLYGGHPLWAVSQAPQVKAHQHNRRPFCDTCHILRTLPLPLFPLLKVGWGFWSSRLSLSLKIRAGVRVKLRSPVAARYSELRGVYEARLKGRLSIQNRTQRESTATRRLSPHYGQNERTEKDMRGTCLSSLPVPGGPER